MTRLERMGRAFSSPNVTGAQSGVLWMLGAIYAGEGAYGVGIMFIVFAVLFFWLSFKMAELRALEAGVAWTWTGR